MADRASWLAERRTCIGASDSPSILGEGYTSALDIWCHKTGLIPDDTETTDSLEIGLALQPAIAEIARHKTGLQIDEANFEVVRHPEYPWLGASLDGVALCPVRGPGVAELKNVGSYNAADWKEPGGPLAFQIQVQHQLMVTGYDWGLLFALIGGNKPVWHIVTRNEPFIGALKNTLTEFWARVLAKEPPPPDESESARKALAALYPFDSGETVELPAEAVDWDQRLATVKEQLSALGEEKAQLENNLRAAIKDATFAVLPNGGGYSLKAQKRAAYAVEEAEFRVLRRFQKLPKGAARFISQEV